MMETASTTAPGVSPTDLTVNMEVDVESRTWAGINKPGGHATVVKIHVDDNNVANKVDVRYVLGGRELEVELTYVKMHVELERRGRSRRSDKKMNVETLGGVPGKKKVNKKQGGGGAKKRKGSSSSSSPVKKEGGKKRKALASIDGNHSKAKAAKKGEEDVEYSQNAVDIPEEVVEEDGKWTLIQDGRITDYTDTLQKGQRIAYWWSDEDGWLKGNVTKALTKVVTASTIRWPVKVDFDNGDKHSLDFHPLEKRWKVFHSNEKPSAEKAKDEQIKKSATVKQIASKKTSKPVVGDQKDGKVKADKKAKTAKKAGEKNKTAKATKTKENKQMKTPTLSFGSELQSKIKEISSKMHTAKSASEGGLVNYSPNSILAVKAAHAKSPMASLSTESIGFSESFPPDTLSPAGKKKLPQDIEENRARAASSQVSLISSRTSLSKSWNSEVVQSKGSSKYAKSIKASDNGGPQTVLQSLYKKESDKAEDFVDFMTDSSKIKGKEKSTVASSPGSDDDGDLELKMDQERMRLFISTLSEIMFKKGLYEMDVEEMIGKINTHHKSSKPFTHLEIKPYLQEMHDDGRIFIVEDEGKMGVAYAMT
mmetsp:Transcript_27276/g.58401  ORF Transcript_27276/g.58401 Transcript_27276/m.58401 type:complete len:594 (-) Transcript_27276:674-2455(-)